MLISLGLMCIYSNAIKAFVIFIGGYMPIFIGTLRFAWTVDTVIHCNY